MVGVGGGGVRVLRFLSRLFISGVGEGLGSRGVPLVVGERVSGFGGVARKLRDASLVFVGGLRGVEG